MSESIEYRNTGASSSIRGRQSVGDFRYIARRWGYDFEVSSIADDAADHNEQRGEAQPIVEGVVTAVELPCGVKFCANDLVVSRDNERAAIIPRSLNIILELDAGPGLYRMGAAECSLSSGCAAVVTAAQSAKLAGHFRQGDRSRSLVLQVCPYRIQDEDLMEQVHRSIADTGIRLLPVNSRLRSLTNEIFAACHAGPVARLLAESCALELLARCLAVKVPPNTASDIGVHARDIVRIERVRDTLISELARDHRLCDLARLAGMSVSSLKVKFRLVVGQSVFEFLRDQRLERARSGLKDEGWTVKQAAYFVGYAHPNNFATAYRRKFGSSPRQAPHH